jgi:hypothetical protein
VQQDAALLQNCVLDAMPAAGPMCVCLGSKNRGDPQVQQAIRYVVGYAVEGLDWNNTSCCAQHVHHATLWDYASLHRHVLDAPQAAWAYALWSDDQGLNTSSCCAAIIMPPLR